MTRKKIVNDPWMPTSVEDTPRRIRISGVLSKEDVRAIWCCWNGNANEHQQKLAMHAIIYGIARMSDSTYHRGPDGDRDSAFAEGMRHVGSQVQKFCDLGNEYFVDRTKPKT